MKIKLRMELVECAEALLKLNLSTPVTVFEELINIGYHFREELKASPKCNPSLVSALDHRLKRAESLLEQKKRSETL